MPTNDFQPWAIAAGANVESQSTYLSDPALGPGVTSGVASSALFNKSMRQGTFWSAVLGQFIVNNLGVNCVDDGNVNSHINQFTQAISAITRIRLTGNTNFYVSTSGSNSNTGLTSGSPWLTLQYAFNYINTHYDLGGFDVTINLADGTYTSGMIAYGALLGANDSSQFTVASTSGNSNACIISVPGGNACFECALGSVISLQNIGIANSGTNGLHAFNGGTIFHSGLNFGVCASAHMLAENGGLIVCAASYSISGNATNHWKSSRNSMITQNGGTISLTGSPAFNTFAYALQGGGISFITAPVFSGSATGARYLAAMNGFIESFGTTLPGSTGGSTATGGQYE